MPNRMKEVTVPMSHENIEKIKAGIKTMTIRSDRAALGIGLEKGETGLTQFDSLWYKVMCMGPLTVWEAGKSSLLPAAQAEVLRREGIETAAQFMYIQTRTWWQGIGKLWVYNLVRCTSSTSTEAS